MARRSKSTFVPASPMITYKITDPDAYERLNLKRTAIAELQNMELVQMTQYGFKEPVGRYDILKKMEDKNAKYIYPSWLIPGAQRFIVEGLLTGNTEVYIGVPYKKIKEWCLDNPQNYIISVTDIPLATEAEANKAQRAIEKLEQQKAKEAEKQHRKEEQEAMKLRKQDLDKREAALDMRETKLITGLGELSTHINNFISDISGVPVQPKVRRITIKRSSKPSVVMTQAEPSCITPFPASSYMKANGNVSNKEVGNLLYEYMKNMDKPLTTKEMAAWINVYCPEAVKRWASVNHGLSNIIDKNLKDNIKKTDRATYQAI
jgi:hypothetical protein